MAGSIFRRRFDGVLVIGAGLAGLTAALAAAPRRTLVLSPMALGDGAASSWAQGGVAAALSPEDDPDLHAADTLAAGAGLCDPEAVSVLTREGPDAVRRLADLGAPFDRDSDGQFRQSLEAAHSRARVARIGGDGSGAAIMAAVIKQVRAAAHIEIAEGFEALSLLQDGLGTVRGVLVRGPTGLTELVASATILASGGLGGLFAVTTDPARVRGEGMAMAAMAGAQIRDPEFVQFHPTAIDVPCDPAPLATEALRGEGARLVDAEGRPFMPDYHSAAELAPRDVVARAIEMQRRNGAGAFLDAREAVGDAFPHEFPAVFAACRRFGIDPRYEPIPVRPAVHYHMGGIATDLDGATTLRGLWAAGECAAVGVHGANRLASNSLLEAAVFGRRAGLAARDAKAASGTAILAARTPNRLTHAEMAGLRSAMASHAGVVREAVGLSRLLGRLDALDERRGPALPLIAARLVAQAALDRRESRGAHFRSDFPQADAAAVSTRVIGGAGAQRRAA